MTEKNKSETDENIKSSKKPVSKKATLVDNCLLYTSDAADE